MLNNITFCLSAELLGSWSSCQDTTSPYGSYSIVLCVFWFKNFKNSNTTGIVILLSCLGRCNTLYIGVAWLGSEQNWNGSIGSYIHIFYFHWVLNFFTTQIQIRWRQTSFKYDLSVWRFICWPFFKYFFLFLNFNSRI